MLKPLVKLMYRDKLKKFDEKVQKLIYDHYKIELYIDFIIWSFIAFPIASLLTILTFEHAWYDILTCIILLAIYTRFLIWFGRNFYEPIEIFKGLVVKFWHGQYYAAKGKAITADDFEEIKNKSEELYCRIMTCDCNGYCYFTCFSILEALKKGEMKFIAMKQNECDVENHDNNYYTFHVIYVNNGWCYDTFSQRQFPVETVMECLHAKEYRSFSYEDIKGKEYEEFMEENYDNFNKWCEENDCYHELFKLHEN